jgi:hypothetical protein
MLELHGKVVFEKGGMHLEDAVKQGHSAQVLTEGISLARSHGGRTE